MVGDDVAGEAQIDAAAGAAGDTVASPAGVHEGDVELGKAGDDEGLGEGGVEALVGDGIAEEDDAVAGLELEGVLCGAGEREEEEGGVADEGSHGRKTHATPSGGGATADLHLT